MKISFHGACREVGRAAFLIEENNKRIVLDYGVKISPEKNITPLPIKGVLDAVIVSHAHLDHSGAVPMLYKYSEQPCYMTPPSIPMIDLLVEDSIKVNKMKGLKPIFSKKNVKRMIRSVVPVSYSKKRDLGGFSLKFEDAGHILGAASVQIDTSKHKLVYTGDIKFEKTKLHKAAFDDYKNVDVLITESTYGSREHPNRKEIEKKLVEACWDICDDNGNVLIPAFAVGRSQEVITILNSYGFDYPVYMDGMSKKAAQIMFDFPEYVRDSKEMYKALKNVIWVNNRYQREKALDEPSVIVSTAGMLSGGPAINYLLRMKNLDKKAVFFSGYQPEHTPGYKLLNTKRFRYEDYDLNFSDFRIEYFDLSAHADAPELLNFAKKCNPKLCFVIHGEEEQSKTLADKIHSEVGCPAIVPKLGEKIEVEDYI